MKVKRYIVRALACYDTPSQVAAAVKEEFGLTLPRQHVAVYDPTKQQGRQLSKELVALFEQERQRFLAEVDAIPIANQSYRLRALNRLFRAAEEKGNAVLAATLLEQGAKEVGGAFTNTRKLEGGDPSKPVQLNHTHSLSDDDLARIAASGSS